MVSGIATPASGQIPETVQPFVRTEDDGDPSQKHRGASKACHGNTLLHLLISDVMSGSREQFPSSETGAI